MNRDSTPQRKFVVFVSSVTTEFGTLREHLWVTIYKAGHIPVVLEKYSSVTGGNVRQYVEEKVEPVFRTVRRTAEFISYTLGSNRCVTSAERADRAILLGHLSA